MINYSHHDAIRVFLMFIYSLVMLYFSPHDAQLQSSWCSVTVLMTLLTERIKGFEKFLVGAMQALINTEHGRRVADIFLF